MNQAQAQAAQHGQGPMLVLAGPGSGKTFTICQRISYLIAQHVSPHQILVVTFNKTAAKDMESRYHRLCHSDHGISDHNIFDHDITPHKVHVQNAQGVRFGTIHSLCYEILRQDPHYQKQTILSETDKYHLLNSLLKQPMKDQMKDHKKQLPLGKRYEDYKKMHGYLDYDDLLSECLRLLSEQPEILSFFQQKYQYLLVDEFQDVNDIQFQILYLLSKQHRNIMVVGDDDQSIYGFRGAKAGIFQDFLTFFPEGKQVVLDINYRCSKEIIQLSNRCISHNKERMVKHMKGISSNGEEPSIRKYASVQEQVTDIVAMIERKTRDGIKKEQIAVLFRTQNQVDQFMDQMQLIEKQYDPAIHVRKDFWGLSDIKAYVKLVIGNAGIPELLQVMNHPERGLSRFYLSESMQDLSAWANHCHACKEYGQVKSIKLLQQQLLRMKQMSPYVGMQYLIYAMGYGNYGEQMIKQSAANQKGWESFCQDMLALAQKCIGWEAFYQEITAYGDQPDKRGKIHCMTMHKAKGLEFDTVFLPSIDAGVLPNKKAVTKQAVEEERRLFYVALTRAQKHLYLSYTKEKSPFLNELGVSSYCSS